jgi:predicted MFS family arabinose efflux permease
VADKGGRPARFTDVLAVGQFRVLWLAHLQSRIGDQLARVALSILIYDRTGSAALTALTYAMTILPNLAGGALLAGLADRFDRRTVMIASDVLRAALVAALAIPDQPIPLLIVVLVLTQLPAAPFTAARGAILPKILTDDSYVVGVALLRTTDQVGLLVGIGAGAALVAALGTHTALLVDAASFAISAAAVALGIKAHQPPGNKENTPKTWWHSLTAGLALVARDPKLRALVGLACINGFYVIPEGIAVPYANQLRGGTAAVGWLLAAIPAGSILGMLALKSLRPASRLWLMGPLTIATCAVLVPTAWAPPLAVSVLLWAVSGALSAHDMVVQATFVQRVPDATRGQAVGLAGAAMQAAQGIGIVAAGLLAQLLTPAVTVGVAGAAGTVAAGAAVVAWARTVSPRSPSGRGETGDLATSD